MTIFPNHIVVARSDRGEAIQPPDCFALLANDDSLIQY